MHRAWTGARFREARGVEAPRTGSLRGGGGDGRDGLGTKGGASQQQFVIEGRLITNGGSELGPRTSAG